jgi:hypothetical protein
VDFQGAPPQGKSPGAAAAHRAMALPRLRTQRTAHDHPEERVPTVYRSGPYRFYFYSHDEREPPHVHIDRDRHSAKLWLRPVAVASNEGFSEHELKRVERLVRSRRRELLEAWNEYFGI